MIFSNHIVDRDIIPNSHFIQNLETATYKEHINIIFSLKNLFSCKCTKDLLLFILDKVMKINGDGIVSENS